MTSRWSIIISDDVDEKYPVHLRDILSALNNGEGYVWSILDVWYVGDLGSKKPMPELEDYTLKSDIGYVCDFTEISEIASRVEEFIELTLVACSSIDQIDNNRNSFHKICDAADIVIERFDWREWKIQATNPELLETLMNIYPQAVREII